MPFPDGTPTKLVHLTVTNPAGGGAATGSVRLSPNVPAIVIDGTDIEFTGGGTYKLGSQGRLVDSDGTTVGVRLLDNSVAGSNPSGWLWHAIISVDGAPPYSFYFTLAGTEDEVDLSELMQVDPDVPHYVAVPGPRGETGAAGAAGGTGAAGQDGASAYQVAVAGGFVGTETEWLASLVGPEGDAGPAGPQPPLGAAGAGADIALRSTDASTTNARTPTAHKASHATGGSDALTPADIGAESAGTATVAVTAHTAAADPHGDRAWADNKFATQLTVTALNGYVDDTVNRVAAIEQGTAWLSGLNVAGNAIVSNGDLTVSDVSKGYRFRRGGSALDLEATGADLILSNWSGTGFNGTQRAYLRLSVDAQNTQVAGRVEFVNTLYGTTRHVLDGDANTVGLYGAAPVARQTVTGPRSDGTAVTNLLAAAAATGLIVDSTTAGIANAWRRRDLPDPVIADSLYTGTAPSISTAQTTTPTSGYIKYAPAGVALSGSDVTGPFSYLGAGNFAIGTTAPDPSYVLPLSKFPNTYASGQAVWSVEFGTDAAIVQVRMKYISTATMFRLSIDGRKVTDLMQSSGGTTAGSGHLISIDFGSAAPRRIRLDFTTFPFGGIYIPPTATLWGVPAEGGRLMVLGDSISDGSAQNTGAGSGTWFARTARLLGATDAWEQGRGGTGYIIPGSYATFGTRLAADVVAWAPDRLIVWGGYNDSSGDQGAIATAAAALFAAIKAGLPSCQVYIIGCWSPTGSPGAGVTNTDATLRTAAATAGFPFMSPVTGACYDAAGVLVATHGAWITAANAASYVGADAIHPNDAGHVYLSRRITAAIRQLMPA